MIIYQCKYIFMIIVHFDSLLNPAVTVMETDWCLWVGPLKGRWCTKHPRHCQTACSVWHFAWSHSGCAEWSRDGTCFASCPGKFPCGDYTGTVSKIPVLSQLWAQVSFKYYVLDSLFSSRSGNATKLGVVFQGQRQGVKFFWFVVLAVFLSSTISLLFFSFCDLC